MKWRRKRVEFTLSMPNVGSWNGRWSGANYRYAVVRRVAPERAEELSGRSWMHDFGDGWCACVDARVMEPGERKKPSDGFYGYEWMVRNIIAFDSTRKPLDRTPSLG